MQGFVTAGLVMVILYLLLIMGRDNIDQVITNYEHKLDAAQFTQFNDTPSRYYNNWNNTETVDRCANVSEGECQIILNQIEVLPQLIPLPTSEFTKSYKQN